MIWYLIQATVYTEFPCLFACLSHFLLSPKHGWIGHSELPLDVSEFGPCKWASAQSSMYSHPHHGQDKELLWWWMNEWINVNDWCFHFTCVTFYVHNTLWNLISWEFLLFPVRIMWLDSTWCPTNKILWKVMKVGLCWLCMCVAMMTYAIGPVLPP